MTTLTQAQFEIALACQNANLEELQHFDYTPLTEEDVRFGIHLCIQNSMITMKKKITVIEMICRKYPHLFDDPKELISVYYRLQSLNGLTKLFLALSSQHVTAFLHYGEIGNGRITKYIISQYYNEINNAPEQVYSVFRRSAERSNIATTPDGSGYHMIFDLLVTHFRHHFTYYQEIYYHEENMFWIFCRASDSRVTNVLHGLFPDILSSHRPLTPEMTLYHPYQIISNNWTPTDETCVVCYEPSNAVTPCHHYLCQECLPQIRQRSDQCPLCRQPFDFVNVNM